MVDLSIPAHGSVQVNGSVPTDGQRLRVILSLSERSVSMSSGHTELGAWPVWSVEITQVGDVTYELNADGDTVTFVPDDPSQLSRLGIGEAPPSAQEPVRSRRSVAAARGLVERLRSRRGTAPERAATEPQRRVEASPVRTPEPSSEAAPPAVATPGRSPRDREVSTSAMVGGAVRRAWLFAVDTARAYDVLGLDRVPVTPQMRRDPDHQHTWDHRVAAGATRHLCTVCGKVRLFAH